MKARKRRPGARRATGMAGLRRYGALLPVLMMAVGIAPGQENAGSAAKLVRSAVERTTHAVRYDGGYRSIPYPGGDVPDDVGVCTDLIVRAYRGIGIDLQVEVHEDMQGHFGEYPPNWGLEGPDRNIDHRRVPNLQTFLRRRGATLPVTTDPSDYRPGDLVTWTLPGNLPHIGLVTDRRTTDGERPLIVHNIGNGPEMEDALFAYPVSGHFRYLPEGR